MMKTNRFFAWLTALLMVLLPLTAPAEETASTAPHLTEQGLSLGAHSIHYPQLDGLADEELQAAVNSLIVSDGHIDTLLNRLPLVMSCPLPLTVTYDALLAGDVLSCALLAEGPVENDLPTQVWSSANIDITAGCSFTLDDLFAVPADDAREAIEDWLWAEIAPEISAHLSNCELTPLPDVFTVAPEGLTLYYPIRQLSTLSDRAGTVTLRWYELEGLFDFSEGSILDRIGANAFRAPGEDAAAAMRTCVAEGRLPGIPAVLGMSMQEVTDTYRMLTDPDLYEGGRMFSLEDSRFRAAWLLTDALTEKTWDQSIVQGIRADRISLFGLVTGTDEVPGTDAETWHALLGTPDATVQVDADRAELYRIVPGVSDYYRFGDYQLRLHADEDGRLAAIFITM